MNGRAVGQSGIRAIGTTGLTLTLIRHGDTDFTLSGRYQGHRDEPLNAQGRQQAQAVGDRLRAALGDEVNRAQVFASDLQRAHDTARLALPHQAVTVDARLREFNFGSFEGFTAAENQVRTAAFGAWINDPESNPPPGGETLSAFSARLAAWLGELESDSVFAFTHGGAVRMLIALATGRTFQELGRLLSIAPTDVVRLRLDEVRCCTLESLQWLRCPPVLEVARD